jgi:hypothetical protein
MNIRNTLIKKIVKIESFIKVIEIKSCLCLSIKVKEGILPHMPGKEWKKERKNW